MACAFEQSLGFCEGTHVSSSSNSASQAHRFLLECKHVTGPPTSLNTCIVFSSLPCHQTQGLGAVQLINVDPDRFEDADGDEAMQGSHAPGR